MVSRNDIVKSCKNFSECNVKKLSKNSLPIQNISFTYDVNDQLTTFATNPNPSKPRSQPKPNLTPCQNTSNCNIS